MGNVANQLNNRQDPYGISANDVAKASKECVIHVRVPAAYPCGPQPSLDLCRAARGARNPHLGDRGSAP